MTYLGDWELVEIGLYPEMTWAAHNYLSVWRKISDLSILVRLGSLTRLRLRAVKFLSVKKKTKKNKDIIREKSLVSI